MIRAKDIMSTNVISVKKDDSIFEAIKLLVEKNVSGLPVVDDDMTLTGILSEKDVVDLYYEHEQADSKTVGDYMTHPAVCFDENNALINVCNFLVKNIFRRVPVTSGGKLVGIISIKDILNSVLQLRQEQTIAAN
ncbi:MAG: CBS domain-containing protein [Planctomycetes bacterium]|nr:CBS domain-containing protein [Planctomycetota bacterium]